MENAKRNVSEVTYYGYDDLLEAEKLIPCPFNEAHKVVAKRMQKHLAKCRGSYPGVEVTTCRYNRYHYVKVRDIEKHEKDCPDGKNIMDFLEHYEKGAGFAEQEPRDPDESGIDSLPDGDVSANGQEHIFADPSMSEESFEVQKDSSVADKNVRENPQKASGKRLNRADPFEKAKGDNWDVEEEQSYNPNAAIAERVGQRNEVLLRHVQFGTKSQRKAERFERSMQNKMNVNELQGPKHELNPSINYSHADQNYGPKKILKKPKPEIDSADDHAIGGTAAVFFPKPQ